MNPLNQDEWSVLKINADVPVREMLFAYISHVCLGVFDKSRYSEYYFQKAHVPQVEKQLIDLAGKFAFQYSWQTQKRENWHLAWKDGFTPVRVGDRMIIVPDWDDENNAEITIRVRPGFAFGTGHHETTFFMLQELLERVTPGISVLDVGTGSGILAIAAKKLGAGPVVCLEYDIQCKENFIDNIKLNGLENELTFTHADALRWDDYSQDLILVNVNRNMIIQLIPRLKNAAGTLIFAGILGADTELLTAECEKQGISVISRKNAGEWSCLIARPYGSHTK